jgi:hypothetical protein
MAPFAEERLPLLAEVDAHSPEVFLFFRFQPPPPPPAATKIYTHAPKKSRPMLITALML